MTTQTAEQQSPAERQRARLDSFMKALETRSEQFSNLLSDSGVSPTFFLAVARRALGKTPDLIKCTPDSLMQAFINAATDGLVPDGREGAITSFTMNRGQQSQHDVAQWNPMVQGLLKVAYRSGNFLSIEAQVVYDGEFFEYELGDAPFIRHKRNATSVAGRKITNAYAIAKTTNGGIFREVMEKPDLDKIRAVSRATKGPNKDWPEEMARKAPLRRLWKYLPKTQAMDRIIDHDDHTYDLEALKVDPAEPKKIAVGFQPRVVESAGAQPMDIVAPDLEREPVAEYSVVNEGRQEAAEDELPVRELDAEEDHSFPGDRGASAPEPVGADFDVMAWADQFERALPTIKTVKEVTDSWADAKSRGITAKLQHADLDRFDELVAAREGRIEEIRAGA